MASLVIARVFLSFGWNLRELLVANSGVLYGPKGQPHISPDVTMIFKGVEGDDPEFFRAAFLRVPLLYLFPLELQRECVGKVDSCFVGCQLMNISN